jgi:hypothetical protein
VKLLLAFCYNELASGVPTACQVWSAVALPRRKRKRSVPLSTNLLSVNK